MEQDYSVIIFPKLQQFEQVQTIRQRYDPLASKIGPHISLVFPFRSALAPTALGTHIASKLATVSPIAVEFSQVQLQADQYLFWQITTGAATLSQLHDELYTGPLQQFRRWDLPYTPHVTLGQLKTPALMTTLTTALSQSAMLGLQHEQVKLTTVALEEIQVDDSSRVLATFNLK